MLRRDLVSGDRLERRARAEHRARVGVPRVRRLRREAQRPAVHVVAQAVHLRHREPSFGLHPAGRKHRLLHDLGEQRERRIEVAHRHRQAPAETLESCPHTDAAAKRLGGQCDGRTGSRARPLERTVRHEAREPLGTLRLRHGPAAREHADVDERRARARMHEYRHIASGAEHVHVAHDALPRRREVHGGAARGCTVLRWREDRRRRRCVGRLHRAVGVLHGAQPLPQLPEVRRQRRRRGRAMHHHAGLLRIEVPLHRALHVARAGARKPLVVRRAERHAPLGLPRREVGRLSVHRLEPAQPSRLEHALRARQLLRAHTVRARRLHLAPRGERRIGQPRCRRLGVHHEHAHVARRVLIRGDAARELPLAHRTVEARRTAGSEHDPGQVERRRVGVTRRRRAPAERDVRLGDVTGQVACAQPGRSGFHRCRIAYHANRGERAMPIAHGRDDGRRDPRRPRSRRWCSTGTYQRR